MSVRRVHAVKLRLSVGLPVGEWINKWNEMTIEPSPAGLIWVIPCEITQKSAILTPTPFDFGENW